MIIKNNKVNVTEPTCFILDPTIKMKYLGVYIDKHLNGKYVFVNLSNGLGNVYYIYIY